MCDTFVVLPESTKDGLVIFGKNSDREPNEAQEVVMLPAVDHQLEGRLHCTFIDIPQVEHTHGVLLLKPFWMWGAEMGANEHGVVIGNEAVFTRLPVEKTDALTGMDLIRLGLERSLTAAEALETIITLIEKYGQGGNGGFTHPFYYHNSFIIADRREAWVLEAAGKEWAVEKASGVRSISNAITIGSTWDRASRGLVDTAVRRGWCKSKEDFDFGRCYSEPVFTTFGAGKYRQACTTGFLNFRKGQIGVEDAFSVLRAHSVEAKDTWRPDTALTGAEVCMHVGFGPVRISQSVGSFVAHLTQDRHTYWVNGTSAPCTSLFKPLWFEGGIPWSAEPAPTGTYDPACLWWRHEKLHRRIITIFHRSWQNSVRISKSWKDVFWMRRVKGETWVMYRLIVSPAPKNWKKGGKRITTYPQGIGNKLRILDFCQEPLSKAQNCNFRVFRSHRFLIMVKLAPDG